MNKNNKDEVKIVPLKEHELNSLIDWAYTNESIWPYIMKLEKSGTRAAFGSYNQRHPGVKAGMADVIFSFPSKGFNGLFIKVKRIGKHYEKPRRDELRWMEMMRKIGYKAEVTKGHEEAKNVILEYLE